MKNRSRTYIVLLIIFVMFLVYRINKLHGLDDNIADFIFINTKVCNSFAFYREMIDILFWNMLIVFFICYGVVEIQGINDEMIYTRNVNRRQCAKRLLKKIIYRVSFYSLLMGLVVLVAMFFLKESVLFSYAKLLCNILYFIEFSLTVCLLAAMLGLRETVVVSFLFLIIELWTAFRFSFVMEFIPIGLMILDVTELSGICCLMINMIYLVGMCRLYCEFVVRREII